MAKTLFSQLTRDAAVSAPGPFGEAVRAFIDARRSDPSLKSLDVAPLQKKMQQLCEGYLVRTARSLTLILRLLGFVSF